MEVGNSIQVFGGGVLPGGDLIVSGSQGGFPAIWQLNPTGSTLDPVFNGTGTFVGPSPGSFPSIAVDPANGDIFVTYDTSSATAPFQVKVFSPFGRPEAPFGTSGLLNAFLGSTNSFLACPPPAPPPLARGRASATTGRARAVTVRGDGKVLVAGSLGGKMAVARLPTGLINRTMLPSSVRAVSLTR